MTLIACETCGQVHQLDQEIPNGSSAQCTRCDSMITRRSTRSLHLSAAFALAGLILFIPANAFPILYLEQYGVRTSNTVWEGVRRFWIERDFVIAIIVLLASIVIPLLKLAGLLFVIGMSWLEIRRLQRLQIATLRLIEGLGRWAMLDVFIVAVLISLVKLQKLASITPGSGLFAFSLVVVFTLLASASFDSQLIWEKKRSDL